MSKILLLDTNFSASPIYNFLIKNNNEVVVAGANPTDFLAKSAKNYINIDYSNIDKVRALIESLKIDYLIPGCNDRSYQICAQLNSDGRFFGLDTTRVTEIINNKEQFRTFASGINLPVPSVIPLDQVGDLWPIIVKPVDAYSGHGMTILNESERDLLPTAVQLAKEFSRSKKYIIEEYLNGQLYSHSAFVTEGKILIDFIVEEHCTANPFVVDTSRVIYDFPKEMLYKIREAISLMVKNLNLVNGLVHTQFIKRGESFWIIEVTRRCPGDLYSQLIEISTGFSYAETYSKPFINQQILLPDSPIKKGNVLRHTMSQPEESILGSIKFNFPVQIEKLVPLSLAGDCIKASPFSRIALLFLKANTKNELAEIFDATLRRELYLIQ